MSHTCALCGQIVFKTLHEYETHRAAYHGIKRTIRPEKVTGRNHMQIVDDAEATWLKPHIVVTEEPLMESIVVISTNNEHLEACRCMECFNKQLDRIIANQEVRLKDLNGGTNNAD